MTLRVAINGFGRIGRLVLRAALEQGRNDIDFVAVNDLGSAETNAHLLSYDSVHGPWTGDLQVTDDRLRANGYDIRVLSELRVGNLPWAELGVDVVLECTGRFTEREEAARHLAAGAKRVLVSAPANGADLTVVYGVNHQDLKGDHKIVSNASCTTNCLAPVAKVLNDAVGIQRGYMTTVHSYTGDQRTVDSFHKDPYRARGAASNLIPTTTGAARAVGLVLPELEGKLDGAAIRVPTPNVSLVDLTFTAARETTAAEINGAIAKAAQEGPLRGILAVNDKPLASADFNHNPASSIFDSNCSSVVDGVLGRVVSWYDNEWGFSNRMLDTTAAMGARL